MRSTGHTTRRHFGPTGTIPLDVLERHKRIRNTLRWIGVPLLLIGLILLLVGFIIFISQIGSPDEDPFQRAITGWILFAVGGFISPIGLIMVYISFLGKFAKYVANENRDAVSIVGDSAGYGISRGIRRGGGIPLTHIDSGGGSRGDRIRIRCRKCGYLDTEDAEFCSRCGSRL